MRKELTFSLFFLILTLLFCPLRTYAEYSLVIGSYRQGPGGKPKVSGITSPTLFSIPIKTKKACLEAGSKIEEDIYKPVWQFDSKWTCIFTGKGN